MLSSARLESRRQYALFFLVVALVVGGGFWWAQRRGAPASLLSVVPADAWLVVTVDVAALRSSPAASPVLGTSGATVVPGLGPLADACGFDPTSRLDQLLVCSPENGERGEFGVAFTGTFTRDELSRCAEKITHSRAETAVRSTRGDFVLLEDPADPSHTRLAYREGGPFLVGRGAWLDAMIDAAGAHQDLARPEHANLRAALATHVPGATPAIVVTAVLPATVRQKLRTELGSELGTEGERTYASVLAVGSAGLAVFTGPAGSSTDVAAELRCESADACAEVKTLVERQRLGLSKDFGVRLVGLGPLVDALTVTQDGTKLGITTRAATDDLGRALDRVVASRSRHRPTPPSPSASAPLPPPSAAAGDAG